MGIKNLMALLKSKAPDSIISRHISDLSEKKIVRDASIGIYQYLIATNFSKSNKTLQDSEGNPTAHLIGIINSTLLYRTYKIFPIWVFDGKSPDLKKRTAEKRTVAKESNLRLLELAKVENDQELMNKYAARSLSLTKQIVDDAKTLLGLLGESYVEAPSEAEAECAHLIKTGVAEMVFSEDLDSLAFGASTLVRGNSDLSIIKLETVLSQLKLSFFEFLDLCILLGCDYTDNIKGIGQINALQLIRKFKSIENICTHIQSSQEISKKWTIPQEFKFQEARDYFLNPEVNSGKIVSSKRNDEGLFNFLVTQKDFSAKRVESFLKKIKDL